MNSTKLHAGLRALTVGIYLSVFAAMPAFGAPSPTPKPSPVAAPATAEKARPFPFKSVVASVDPAARTFTMGKKTIHRVHVLPETKISQGDGAAAGLEALKPGTEIRGSVRKRADGEYEAVSVKIGPKP